MCGSAEEIDLIIWCTGFRISFPFIDERHLNWDDDHPDLYLNIFHPDYDDLFVAGLIESSGGGWGTRDQQANLIAKFIRAQWENSEEARRLQDAKRRHGARRKQSRNGAAGSHGSIYVDYHDYKRKLDRLIESMG